MILFLRNRVLDHRDIFNGLMYDMNKSIFALAIVSLSTICFGQTGKLKKADNYYTKVAYAEAANIYSELIGSELDSPELKVKLADCYYQMGDTEKAGEVFSAVVEEGEIDPDALYKYAQSLKENGNYQASDSWMNKFYKRANTDLRAKEFISNESYMDQIKNQEAYFEIKLLSINTLNAEFGGYPFGTDQAYFVTNRHKRFGTNRSHTYNSKRFLDLFVASITEDNELEAPEFKSRKVNKKFHEGPLCFSPDLKTVYFTRNNISNGKLRKDNKGIQNLKIYIADIDDKGNWRNERELPVNSKDYSVGHPFVTSNGTMLYFVSDMPGGYGGADIYRMPINDDGSYGTPENLGYKINTEGQEMFPWMSNDDLLFFASDGHLGLGGLDVFVVIPKKDGAFFKLMNVGEPVNTSKDDFALIMSADNVTGFVSSNRSIGMGDDDIYSFRLLRPFKLNLIVKGVVREKGSNTILPGATVELLDSEGNVLEKTIATNDGEYSFALEPDIDYTINAKKEDYFEVFNLTSTKNLSDGTEEIIKNLSLEKDPGLSLYAIITDSKTSDPLEGVSVQLINDSNGERTGYTTLKDGALVKPLPGMKLDEKVNYTFQLFKEGYIPKVVTCNIYFDREGQYNVHSVCDLTMDPVVEDLRDLIEINPINFDLGKWNIRNDAEIELDKIVEIMNKYPNMVIELGSHTDCRASKSFNMQLSDKRAKSSAKYIQSKITNPERIYGKGYGESRLLNDCACEGSIKSDCSEEEHEKNRRTEFKVISVGDDK